MRLVVPAELRKQVAEIVNYPLHSFFLTRLGRAYLRTLQGRKQETAFPETEFPDVVYFRHQMRALVRQSEPAYVAMFKDADDARTNLPVVVRVPDLHNLQTPYYFLLESLGKSGLKLEKINANDAQEVFIDRLSEFVVAAITQAGSGATLPPTVVNSNRHGDTVLYAKGFFVSTGAGFGVSTPATGYLSRGRYSFGIMDSGMPRFEGIVWDCPHPNVRLNLP